MSREQETGFTSHVQQTESWSSRDTEGQGHPKDHTQQLPLSCRGHVRFAIIPDSILERERIWDEHLKGKHSLVERRTLNSKEIELNEKNPV